MTEGRIFVCCWSFTDGAYRLWVRDLPMIAAAAETFADAEEELEEEILARTGDGEHAREFLPPRPHPASESTTGGLLSQVTANASAHIENLVQLYEGDPCTVCFRPRGPRTAAQLKLKGVKSGVNGTRAGIRVPAGRGPKLRCFSGEFLALLHEDERDQCEWRPVLHDRKGREFYELVVVEPPAPYVARRGAPTILEECRECGGRSAPLYWQEDGTPSLYVSADCISAGSRAMIIGDWHSPSLCLSPERWMEIAGSSGAKGLMSTMVGILPGHAIDYQPAYTTV